MSRFPASLRRARERARPLPLGEALLELAHRGPAPLARERGHGGGTLSVACVIPSFRRGSGGHATVVHLLQALAARGHEVSLWLEDSEGWHRGRSRASVRESFRRAFPAEGIGLETDLSAWRGADVVLATGWQTVPRVLLLAGAGARAYLVQDHEPEFYPASAEALWAADTYRRGLHCIAASEWLAALLRERYGASASHFDLAVEHSVYHPGEPGARGGGGQQLVVLYARAATPRRAVPLGLLALAELHRRRPAVGIGLYGEERPLAAPFAHSNFGVLAGGRLAALYRRATVGLALSLTNPSLAALEMMACGLPCVELASPPILDTFGPDGPLALAGPDAESLCGAIERLLDDPDARDLASARGLELMSTRSWERAAVQVEDGLRLALDRGEAAPR